MIISLPEWQGVKRGKTFRTLQVLLKYSFQSLNNHTRNREYGIPEPMLLSPTSTSMIYNPTCDDEKCHIIHSMASTGFENIAHLIQEGIIFEPCGCLIQIHGHLTHYILTITLLAPTSCSIEVSMQMQEKKSIPDIFTSQLRLTGCAVAKWHLVQTTALSKKKNWLKSRKNCSQRAIQKLGLR